MNEVVCNKQRKKERSPLNPKRPHDSNGSPTRNIGIPIPVTDEWKNILRHFREDAVRQDSSVAHVYREALLEYDHRHFPGGNPDPKLNCFMGSEPFSAAAEEKLSQKDHEKPTVDYGSMSLDELRALAKKRFLSDRERSYIKFFIDRKEANE